MFGRREKKTAVIIGLGEFGLHLALNLSKHGCDCVVADKDSNRVESVREYVMKAVVADVLNKDSIAHFVPAETDFAVISLGNVEASIMATLHLKDMGIDPVYVKAISQEHERILRLMGISRTIFPEKDMGERFATKLMNHNLLDYLPLSEDYSVAELAPLRYMEGKTLKELDFRKKYNLSIMAIREYVPQKLVITPGADFVVKISDTLLVLGERKYIENYNRRSEE